MIKGLTSVRKKAVKVGQGSSVGKGLSRSFHLFVGGCMCISTCSC